MAEKDTKQGFEFKVAAPNVRKPGFAELFASGLQLGGALQGNRTTSGIGSGLLGSLQQQAKMDQANQQKQQVFDLQKQQAEGLFNQATDLQSQGILSPAQAKSVQRQAQAGKLTSAEDVVERASKVAQAKQQKRQADADLLTRQKELAKFRRGIAPKKGPAAVKEAIKSGDLSSLATAEQIEAVPGVKKGTGDAILEILQGQGAVPKPPSFGQSLKKLNPDLLAASLGALQKSFPILDNLIPDALAQTNAQIDAERLQNFQQGGQAPQAPQAQPQAAAGERLIRRQSDGAVFIQDAQGNLRPAGQ